MFEKKKYPLVNGRLIRFRRFQQLIWAALSALLGAGFVAGLYWLSFEQRYAFLPGSGSATLWWHNGMGGLIRSPRWDDYRHAIRDNGEPALWVMVAATLLGTATGRPRVLLRSWMLALAPLFLLVALIAGAVGIAWITVVGPLSHVSDTFSWQQLVLGAILGRVLHFAWAPTGSTIRYRITSGAAARTGIPLWVTLPLLPPEWRESWAELRSTMSGSLKERTDKYRQSRVVIPLMILVFLFIAIVGNLAKYVIAHGGHIPGMTS